MMKSALPVLLVILGTICWGGKANAYLTSDFDTAVGILSIRMKLDETVSNLQSPASLSFSYNINYAALNTAVTIGAMETIDSNQGKLAYTRFGFGARVFPLGLQGNRVIIDSKTEARKFASAPWIGGGLGFANIGITNVSSDVGFYNAVAMEIQLAAGNEIVLDQNLFLTGQVIGVIGTGSPRNQFSNLSYTGLGLMLGLKLATF